MPRLNRTTTQFGVPTEGGGVQLWTAEFEHKHEREARGDKPGKFLVVSGRHGQMRVKHITRCVLRTTGSSKTYYGSARASIKDEYQWMEGLRIAFQRALADMELCVELTDHVTCRWSEECESGRPGCKDKDCENPKHYRGGHNSTLPVFKALKPEYKYFMQGFFTEMRHRDGAVSRPVEKIVEGQVVAEIPSAPTHGMGHVEKAPQALNLLSYRGPNEYQGPLSGEGWNC